jgi:SAM-dependent methyltransferase
MFAVVEECFGSISTTQAFSTLIIEHPKEKLSNGQTFQVSPDLAMDFRKLELPDASFSLVVFDPPHLRRNGHRGWMAKKYGSLNKLTWRDDIRAGFRECFRVLKPQGVLIFKWNEHEVPLKHILALSPRTPLFGHPSGASRSKTHWIAFMK